MLKWLQFILLILVMAETDEDRHHRKDVIQRNYGFKSSNVIC